MPDIHLSPPFVVYAEETPNPSVMKFVADKSLLPPGMQMEFLNSPSTGKFPLVENLFRFPFVNKLYVASNYISIEKKDFAEWGEIYAELRNFISEFLNKNGFLCLMDEYEIASSTNSNCDDKPVNYKGFSISHSEPKNEIEQKIVEILEHYIRPGVESDGGFIAFRRLEEKKVYLELRGSCKGCPSSVVTLKNGIEALMKRLLPESVEEVISTDGN